MARQEWGMAGTRAGRKAGVVVGLYCPTQMKIVQQYGPNHQLNEIGQQPPKNADPNEKTSQEGESRAFRGGLSFFERGNDVFITHAGMD